MAFSDITSFLILLVLLVMAGAGAWLMWIFRQQVCSQARRLADDQCPIDCASVKAGLARIPLCCCPTFITNWLCRHVGWEPHSIRFSYMTVEYPPTNSNNKIRVEIADQAEPDRGTSEHTDWVRATSRASFLKNIVFPVRNSTTAPDIYIRIVVSGWWRWSSNYTLCENHVRSMALVELIRTEQRKGYDDESRGWLAIELKAAVAGGGTATLFVKVELPESEDCLPFMCGSSHGGGCQCGRSESDFLLSESSNEGARPTGVSTVLYQNGTATRMPVQTRIASGGVFVPASREALRDHRFTYRKDTCKRRLQTFAERSCCLSVLFMLLFLVGRFVLGSCYYGFMQVTKLQMMNVSFPADPTKASNILENCGPRGIKRDIPDLVRDDLNEVLFWLHLDALASEKKAVDNCKPTYEQVAAVCTELPKGVPSPPGLFDPIFSQDLGIPCINNGIIRTCELGYHLGTWEWGLRIWGALAIWLLLNCILCCCGHHLADCACGCGGCRRRQRDSRNLLPLPSGG